MIEAAAPAQEFDYVIIGAGSAGCVLANRLSSDPRNRVCLIEAGPRDRNPLIHIPLGIIALYKHSSLNWQFQSEPQPRANGRSLFVPRGRTLGGSSSVNGMVYSRGHPSDYDDWAALGNPGWAYEDVLPYFRRSENSLTWRHSPVHGTEGELITDSPRVLNPMVQPFLDAVAQRGLPLNEDFDAGEQEGFGLRQLNIHKGRRVSTAVAFLRPAQNRPNLQIVTDATVDRVLIEDGRATAVQLIAGARRREIKARSEILLSAGSIGSPLILMRSGIGPADALGTLGIDVVRNVPGVGRNLQDHPSANIQFWSPTAAPYGLSLRALPWLAGQLLAYALRRRGLFASNGMQASGYLRSDPSLTRPDFQYVFQPMIRSNKGKFGIVRGHGYGLNTVLLRPKSRGSVALSARELHARPRIDFNLFADPSDMERMLRGLKIARDILAAPAFDPFRGAPLRQGWAGSDDDLEAYVREVCSTVFHPVGTCAMGPSADAVVDPALRVKGIAGLRVVDASVMPTIVGGNTSAPTIMIAERAADLIAGR